MPNTLAHLGVQGFASRAIMREADLNWVYLGCVIPDLPWILQRVVWMIAPHTDLYDIRLYAIVQSSLFMCVVLCGGVALLTRSALRTFLILSLNVLFHLLLDASQTKIANGVHLIAPLDWELLNFGFFWPESWPTLALTLAGLGYFVYAWWTFGCQAQPIFRLKSRRTLLAAALLVSYLAGPILFMGGAEAADTHFVQTLRNRSSRPGKALDVDRGTYVHRPDGDWMRIFTGEEFRVVGGTEEYNGKASIRATFVDRDSIRIHELHRHDSWPRNIATYFALGLIMLNWLRWLIARARLRGEKSAR